MVDYAIKLNDDGHYFPIFCTCRSFQDMIEQISKGTLPRDQLNNVMRPGTLGITEAGFKSKLFKGASDRYLQSI